MKTKSFPEKIKAIEPFSDRFDAFKLAASGCDVLFGTYPADTVIKEHDHDTDNWGVITKGAMFITVDEVETRYSSGNWYEIRAGASHAARCEENTDEIEFWFKKTGTSHANP